MRSKVSHRQFSCLSVSHWRQNSKDKRQRLKISPTVTDVSRHDYIFWVSSGSISFSFTISDLTVRDCTRFQTSPQEVLFTGEVHPKTKILQVKIDKKQRKKFVHFYWFYPPRWPQIVRLYLCYYSNVVT